MGALVDFVIAVFMQLSAILALISPIFTVAAFIDFTHERRMPVLFHVAGLFAVFTALLAYYGLFEGPEPSVFLKVPAAIGLVMLWVCALYVAIKKRRF